MSMVATRIPFEAIGMNSVAGSPATRRSARLSAEDNGEEEAINKRPRDDVIAGSTTIASGKRPKRKKDYDQESDGFVFTKSKRAKASKEPTTRHSNKQGDGDNLEESRTQLSKAESIKLPPQQRTRKQLPASPERRSPAKPARRQQSQPAEPPKSPFRAAHARSHANASRSPSPQKSLTVEKKRRKHVESHGEDGRAARIVLPAANTPIIRRNKAMRASVANGEKRRTSSGMRGRRASSMMDEGKWNALPHSDVVASEFYTIISPDLTEPRRMRLLLGWCGDRALPPKVQAPSGISKQASEDFQAAQAARVIQEELSKELSSNGSLSEWFSRDIEEPPPKVVLRKKPNPRNIANVAKAEELTRELERLQLERKAWDEVTTSAEQAHASSSKEGDGLSPLHPDLLSSPQRAIFEQLTQPQDLAVIDPIDIQRRLQDVSLKLEFAVDNFAHSVHAVSTTRDLAEHIAQRSMSDAAQELDRRDQTQAARSEGRKVDPIDALRGLAKVLNARK